MSGSEKPETQEAVVLNIQRMSTEDGPGIRTSVFFKGCSLKCTWCHNPESILAKPQIQWIGTHCIGCKTCLDVCENGALSFTPEGVAIDRDRCIGCGACADECPSTAMDLLGKRWTLEGLIAEVAKDRVYFEKSEGGITATGGEPTVQAPFVAAFLKGLRETGIPTALDTCGQCARRALDAILPHADMVLFDVKEIDPDRHKTFTGVTNERILENLIHVAKKIRADGNPKRLWVRTPIIPNATDREENIRGIGAFIASNLQGAVQRWELCAFNNLCRDKYVRLGIDWAFKDDQPMTREDMEALAQAAKSSGVDPDIVHWTGATRTDIEEKPGGDKNEGLRLVKSCATG